MINTRINNLHPPRYVAASPTANGFYGGGLNWRRETAGSVLLPKPILSTRLISILSSSSPRRTPILPDPLLFHPEFSSPVVFSNTILSSRVSFCPPTRQWVADYLSLLSAHNSCSSQIASDVSESLQLLLDCRLHFDLWVCIQGASAPASVSFEFQVINSPKSHREGSVYCLCTYIYIHVWAGRHTHDFLISVLRYFVGNL